MAEKKHKIQPKVILYILLAVAGAVLSGWFIIFMINKANSDSPGWYEVSVTTDSSDSFYTDITFKYYLDGSSDEITAKEKDLTNLYTNALKSQSLFLDSTTHYDGYPNLYDINNHLGEDITVSDYTYKTLQDAYNKSLEENNYSIFASLIYNFWDGELYTSSSENTKMNDPLYSESRKEVLEKLVDFTNDLTNFNLTFKENNIVSLNVSDELKLFVEENGLDNEYISLNLLYDAYLMDNIKNVFEENNYLNGYLYNNDGLIITLSGCTQMNLNFYDYQNSNIYRYGYYSYDGKKTISQFRRFEILSRSASPYKIIKDDAGNEVLRNKYLDLKTGYPLNLFNDSTVISEGGLVDNVLINLKMCSISTKTELDLFTKEVDDQYSFVYTLADKDLISYQSSAINDSITLVTIKISSEESLQYNSQII